MTNTNDNGVVLVAHIVNESDKNLLHFNYPTPAITVQPDITEVEFIRDFRQPCATQHRQYTGTLATLFGHIIYITLQHLHL